ncbi:hypothetical protein HPB50_021623 [Hyalomma asiaticum]|uniref:Uncharacterized protein n=1 Tax=Hyalomma asiaticum TaxID=266040 RepID=A0ACB7T110_HYAAI|nr:hypothetical protein HPB50_021623 [Hyalomma asiaticum]
MRGPDSRRCGEERMAKKKKKKRKLFLFKLSSQQLTAILDRDLANLIRYPWNGRTKRKGRHPLCHNDRVFRQGQSSLTGGNPNGKDVRLTVMPRDVTRDVSWRPLDERPRGQHGPWWWWSPRQSRVAAGAGSRSSRTSTRNHRRFVQCRHAIPGDSSAAHTLGDRAVREKTPCRGVKLAHADRRTYYTTFKTWRPDSAHRRRKETAARPPQNLHAKTTPPTRRAIIAPAVEFAAEHGTGTADRRQGNRAYSEYATAARRDTACGLGGANQMTSPFVPAQRGPPARPARGTPFGIRLCRSEFFSTSPRCA